MAYHLPAATQAATQLWKTPESIGCTDGSSLLARGLPIGSEIDAPRPGAIALHKATCVLHVLHEHVTHLSNSAGNSSTRGLCNVNTV